MANGVNGNDGVKLQGVLPKLKEKVGGVVDKLESTGIFDNGAISKAKDGEIFENGAINKAKEGGLFENGAISKVKDGEIFENTNPNTICPICNNILNYSKNFYSQIGHFECNCGYKHKDAKYKATVTLRKNSSVIELDNEKYEIPLIGLFNAYNALGAIVLAKELGISGIQENIKSFKVAFGRSEKRILNGHETIVQLIKNPAGTNEVLKTVDLDSNILIAVNNNVADGTDISWINQVDFEKFSEAKKEIVVSGLCANDMTKRLLQAGVKNIKTIEDIKKSVEYLAQNADNNITVLSTYTALLKIDKIKEMKKCY